MTAYSGAEGGLLGVHRGLRGMIDDAPMNALSDQEAKLILTSYLSRRGPSRIELIDSSFATETDFMRSDQLPLEHHHD